MPADDQASYKHGITQHASVLVTVTWTNFSNEVGRWVPTGYNVPGQFVFSWRCLYMACIMFGAVRDRVDRKQWLVMSVFQPAKHHKYYNRQGQARFLAIPQITAQPVSIGERVVISLSAVSVRWLTRPQQRNQKGCRPSSYMVCLTH